MEKVRELFTRTVVAEQVGCGGVKIDGVDCWVWISCELKSSIDEGVVTTRNRFSVLSEQPDEGHYSDEQDQDCVVYDEITDGGQGSLLETTDAATEIR